MGCTQSSERKTAARVAPAKTAPEPAVSSKSTKPPQNQVPEKNGDAQISSAERVDDTDDHPDRFVSPPTSAGSSRPVSTSTYSRTSDDYSTMTSGVVITLTSDPELNTEPLVQVQLEEAVVVSPAELTRRTTLERRRASLEKQTAKNLAADDGDVDDLEQLKANLAARTATMPRRPSMGRRSSLGAQLMLPTIPQNLVRSKSGSMNDLAPLKSDINDQDQGASPLPHLDLAKSITMNDKMTLAAFGIGAADHESILDYTDSAAIPLAPTETIRQISDIETITSLLGAGDVRQWERRRMSLPTQLVNAEDYGGSGLSNIETTTRPKSSIEPPAADEMQSRTSSRPSISAQRSRGILKHATSPSAALQSPTPQSPQSPQSPTGTSPINSSTSLSRSNLSHRLTVAKNFAVSPSSSSTDMGDDSEAFVKESAVFTRWVESHGVGAIYKPGHIIVEKNDTSREVYYILQGSVEILNQSRDKWYAQVGAGNFVGELGMLYDLPRTATIRVVETLRCRVLSYEEIEAIIESFPLMGRRLLATAASRIDEVAAATNRPLHIGVSNTRAKSGAGSTKGARLEPVAYDQIMLNIQRGGHGGPGGVAAYLSGERSSTPSPPLVTGSKSK